MPQRSRGCKLESVQLDLSCGSFGTDQSRAETAVPSPLILMSYLASGRMEGCGEGVGGDWGNMCVLGPPNGTRVDLSNPAPPPLTSPPLNVTIGEDTKPDILNSQKMHPSFCHYLFANVEEKGRTMDGWVAETEKHSPFSLFHRFPSGNIRRRSGWRSLKFASYVPCSFQICENSVRKKGILNVVMLE